jgi:hypothetical protein
MSLAFARCARAFHPATRRFASSLTSKPASRSQRVLIWGAAALGMTAGCLLISPTTIYLDSEVTKTLVQQHAQEDTIGRSIRYTIFSLV